jgi:hypothetical protein
VRTAGLLLAWWHVPDLHKLERQAAADGLLSDHLRIHKAGKETRTARGLILAGCAVVVVAALVTLSMAPAWAWILLGLVVVRFWPVPGGPRTSPSSPPPPCRCDHRRGRHRCPDPAPPAGRQAAGAAGQLAARAGHRGPAAAGDRGTRTLPGTPAASGAPNRAGQTAAVGGLLSHALPGRPPR